MKIEINNQSPDGVRIDYSGTIIVDTEDEVADIIKKLRNVDAS